MKILAIDDQQLVLLPLKKRLTELGYSIKIETDTDSIQPWSSVATTV